MNQSFILHSVLAQDCHILGNLTHCLVLLNKNALIPWFILVPILVENKACVSDFLDLDEQMRTNILKECAFVSDFVKSFFHCSKVNFGAIGNIVPQMHLHVLGRKEIDCCWPQVVWGNIKDSKHYTEAEISAIQQLLIPTC